MSFKGLFLKERPTWGATRTRTCWAIRTASNVNNNKPTMTLLNPYRVRRKLNKYYTYIVFLLVIWILWYGGEWYRCLSIVDTREALQKSPRSPCPLGLCPVRACPAETSGCMTAWKIRWKEKERGKMKERSLKPYIRRKKERRRKVDEGRPWDYSRGSASSASLAGWRKVFARRGLPKNGTSSHCHGIYASRTRYSHVLKQGRAQNSSCCAAQEALHAQRLGWKEDHYFVK